MPELAEVEYYRKQWLPAVGQRVEQVGVHAEKRIFRGVDASALVHNLVGVSLQGSEAHGKQMVFQFGPRSWLGVHLGMTGKTSIQATGYRPSKHDHLVIRLTDGRQMVFTDARMFGRIRYNESEAPPAWWSDLPPGLLTEGFTLERVSSFLDRRAKAPIKAILLMQETFPGLGNWMVDEILWRCRIQPRTLGGAIGAKKRIQLYGTIREVSRDALRVIGTDWSRPPDSWLFNHRWKDGGHCPQTGCLLQREAIGGRTTCWSPHWQTYRGKRRV